MLSPLAVPQLLAFPYRAQSHGSVVWSETPLPPGELDRVIVGATGLVAQSPLADPDGEIRHIFLSQGGWRWTWLALQSRSAFGLTRAQNEVVLINRSSLAADRTWNGRTIGGQR